MWKFRRYIPKFLLGVSIFLAGQFVLAVLIALGIFPLLVAIVTAVIVAVWAIIIGLPGPVSFVLMLGAFALTLAIIFWSKKLLTKRQVATVSVERTPITDLRGRVVAAGWDTDILSATVGDNDFWTFTVRLKQAALDGAVTFWGRPYQQDVPIDLKESVSLEKIHADHFREFGFDVFQMAKADNYDVFTTKVGKTKYELQGQCYRDLHIDANEAKRWLKNEGKAPPAASFNVQLVTSPGQIGDYNCVFAIIVKNMESNELTRCLVQVEQISITHPDEMPMPLVLRTDGQIRDSRKGRFTLSPNQPKSVPILFKNPTRKNEWFFFDDDGRFYFTPANHSKIVLGIYGGKFSGKVLIDVLVGDDWQAYPSLKIVSDDFTLSETAESGLIPLHEAVMDAWERIRTLPEFDTQPSHSPEFASLRDYYERDPAKLPGIAAQVIFNSANPPLPIEGVAPPRTAMEVIPEDKARGYMFSDDAAEMFDVFDREKPAEQRRRYTNLRVKRTDIERRVKAIEEDNGKR